MAEFKDTAIKLYRRFFGSPTTEADQAAGIQTILSGREAVALAEATISQTAVVSRIPAGNEKFHAFEAEATLNAFGEPLTTLQAEDSRGAMSAAMGLCLAGRRGAALLNGQDISTVQDLLFSASGKHLPLIVHLTNTAMAGHGSSGGSGHEGFHLSCDSGFFTLHASNVQEVVDFTYIARRVAEVCLIPGLVAMDAEQTAKAFQDVQLLSADQIRRFVGYADENMIVPDLAQRLLFGRERRRLPRWQDADSPALQGARFDPETFMLGALGREVFFEGQLESVFSQTLDDFQALTGRRHQAISQYRVADADVVFVVQGSAVETLRAAVDVLRKKLRIKAGVLGILRLRPLPVIEISEALADRRSIVVMERLLSPPGTTGPLSRDIRSALDSLKTGPICHQVIYGVGGAALRVADILLIPARLSTTSPQKFALGVDYIRPQDNHPKRDILQDSVERAYPGLKSMGLKSDDAPTAMPVELLSLAIHDSKAVRLENTLKVVSELLHSLEGGSVCGTLRRRVTGGHTANEAYLLHQVDGFNNPGDDAELDMLVLTDPQQLIDEKLVNRLRQQCVIVWIGEIKPKWQIAEPLRQKLKAGNFRYFCADTAAGSIDEFVGMIFSVLIQSGKKSFKERKIQSARQSALKLQTRSERDTSAGHLQQGLDACVEVEPDFLIQRAIMPRRWDGNTPVSARSLGRGDSQFDSLPRFWDQTGVLFNDGEADQLTVDPYLATGAMPPLSSVFNSVNQDYDEVPVLNPGLCTGCGNCWSVCPDSALAAVAMSPAALIETGLRVGSGEAARQVSGQLATRINTQARKRELASTAGPAIRTEFEWLIEKMDMAPERLELVSDGITNLTTELEDLPLIVSEAFFDSAEQTKKGSGELLSVVANVDACKGCGLCAEQCEPLALTLAKKDDELVEKARRAWNVWAETPDTPAQTIKRLIDGGQINSLAAINLSRFCLHALAGGDNAESGSGEKIALRMVLAIAEYHQQPLLNRFAHDARETLEEVLGHLRGLLSATLPGEDIEELHRILNRIETPQTNLTTLVRETDSIRQPASIDAQVLKRLTQIAENLAELEHRLLHGKQELGRSRFGLVIAPGSVSQWAAEFPFNAFHAPVFVDNSGEAAQLAVGLLQGQLQETCETVAVLRQARLDIESGAALDFERAALKHLQWKDLTADERQLCPPLILVGGDGILAGAGLSQVLWLLSSELPVKIVALADLDLGLAEAGEVHVHHDPRMNLGLVSLAAQQAYIAQTSIAKFDHLSTTVSAAFNYPGPALIRIHAPSPASHGIAGNSAIVQAQLACDSRVLPLFCYDPQAEGVHGKRLSLAGNPDLRAPWQLKEEGVALTPASWAVRQARFAGHFVRLSEESSGGCDISEYLLRDAGARKNTIPVVADDEGVFEVSPAFVDAIEELQLSWRVLQELAGVTTPFTDEVKSQAQQEVSLLHEQELDRVKAEYEDKIRELSAEVKLELASRIRGQLVNLVKMNPPGSVSDQSRD